MKITFIFCEIVLIIFLILVFTFGIRLSGEEAWISGQLLFLGITLIAIAYYILKYKLQQRIISASLIIFFTLLVLISVFTFPKIILSLKHQQKKINHSQATKEISITLNKESAIYKSGKIVGIRFDLSVTLPTNLKTQKYVPILEVPFLADKHEDIYLSLMKTSSCGTENPNTPCKIINKDKDHHTYIEWPPITKNRDIYFTLSPLSGDSVLWLKKNHPGHYDPPSQYFNKTKRTLPLKVSLFHDRKHPLIVFNLKTINTYSMHEIYFNNKSRGADSIDINMK